MNFLVYFYKILATVALTINILSVARAQFWKMNSLSDRDLFIIETRANMASGICYKDVPSKFIDPTRKFKTISYCCDGYVQNTQATGIKCDPVCNEDCKNGICSAPDVCECYPGFHIINGICEEL